MGHVSKILHWERGWRRDEVSWTGPVIMRVAVTPRMESQNEKCGIGRIPIVGNPADAFKGELIPGWSCCLDRRVGIHVDSRVV